jgi:hypothetical protein
VLLSVLVAAALAAAPADAAPAPAVEPPPPATAPASPAAEPPRPAAPVGTVLTGSTVSGGAAAAPPPAATAPAAPPPADEPPAGAPPVLVRNEGLHFELELRLLAARPSGDVVPGSPMSRAPGSAVFPFQLGLGLRWSRVIGTVFLRGAAGRAPPVPGDLASAVAAVGLQGQVELGDSPRWIPWVGAALGSEVLSYLKADPRDARKRKIDLAYAGSLYELQAGIDYALAQAFAAGLLATAGTGTYGTLVTYDAADRADQASIARRSRHAWFGLGARIRF